MDINLKVSLPQDFTILCDLFQVSPETIIQNFINKVSFPFYYSRPDGNERWATLFFLNDITENYPNIEEEFPLHEPFMDALAEVVFNHSGTEPKNIEKAEIAGRKIMKKWHKHILAIRNK
ncbi:hypothetical protein D3C71_1575710 [compost metagenome]